MKLKNKVIGIEWKKRERKNEVSKIRNEISIWLCDRIALGPDRRQKISFQSFEFPFFRVLRKKEIKEQEKKEEETKRKEDVKQEKTILFFLYFFSTFSCLCS